jgi:hypothetical protein
MLAQLPLEVPLGSMNVEALRTPSISGYTKPGLDGEILALVVLANSKDHSSKASDVLVKVLLE